MFHRTAGELGLEVIPLVQCLGHMQTPLSIDANARLREVPHRSDGLNPLARGARALVEKMVDDVLDHMPAPRRLHLGGDEAWSFGTHPDTRAFIEKHGKGALYLHHVEPILDKLNDRGIRPMLWGDMMVAWDDDALRQLANKADLVVWYYSDQTPWPDHVSDAVFEQFADCGITMWGAGAYKGANAPNAADLSDHAAHERNALEWARRAERFKLTGLIATAWSRYSTHDVQCEPIDACLDTLLRIAVIFFDGRRLAGPTDPVAAALRRLGQYDRFNACRHAMEQLSEARSEAWSSMQRLRELIHTATNDERRRTGGLTVDQLVRVRSALDATHAAGEQAQAALSGAMEQIWIDRYLAERIGPLDEQWLPLVQRVRQLDPTAYAAEFEGDPAD